MYVCHSLICSKRIGICNISKLEMYVRPFSKFLAASKAAAALGKTFQGEGEGGEGGVDLEDVCPSPILH